MSGIDGGGGRGGSVVIVAVAVVQQISSSVEEGSRRDDLRVLCELNIMRRGMVEIVRIPGLKHGGGKCPRGR
jgi:hypothetical protein